MVFSIWSGLECISWSETQYWAALLNLHTVPELYKGPFDLSVIQDLCKNLDLNTQEGLVVRVSGQFHYKDFRHKVAKYVRANHVQTHGHWMRSKLVPNKLGDDNA